ncbi:uncharacterized protein [Argopecten irradians]|uniref:uncharacterized protein n=1 Tax=Argopecten irradians TaxID=31199 RepID=UPI003723DC0D
MAMETFDMDDPRSEKFRAVTRRVLVLGVVCLILTVLMVAVVATVLLTAEIDTRQQVNAAALLGKETLMTKLGSSSTQGSQSTASTQGPQSTASLHGSVGSSGTTSSVSFTLDTHHTSISLSTSTDVLHLSTLSSLESSFGSSVLSSSTTVSLSQSLDMDIKPSQMTTSSQQLPPILQSSVFSLTSVSLLPSEASNVVTMETSQMMPSVHFMSTSSSFVDEFDVSQTPSMETTPMESLTFHQTSSIVPSDMTSLKSSKSDTGAHVNSTLEPTLHSPQSTASHHLMTSNSARVPLFESSSSRQLHTSQDILAPSLTILLMSSEIDLKTSDGVLSSSYNHYISSSVVNMSQTGLPSLDSINVTSPDGTSAGVSMTTPSSSQTVVSPSSWVKRTVSTPLLPTTQVSRIPLPSSMTSDLVTPIVLPSTQLLPTLVPSPTTLFPSWSGGAHEQSNSQYQSSYSLTNTITSPKSEITSVMVPTDITKVSTMTGSTVMMVPTTIVSTTSGTSTITASATIVSTASGTLTPIATSSTTNVPVTTTGSSATVVSTTMTGATSVTAPVTITTAGITVDVITTTPPSTTTVSIDSQCPAGQAPCDDGTCLRGSKFCDGVVHCPDTSDEAKDCSCGSGQFRCSSGQCVSSLSRCNGYPQCKDKTDEFNCTGCVGFQCDTGLCFWTHQSRCNQVVDCDDLSDELGCPFRPGYRRCDNGMFLPASDWCNGVDDCYDNSDETDCACDSLTEVACQFGGCIRREWVCDGIHDCNNGTDEEGCNQCSSTDFVCPDYQCVAMDTVCDGQPDCLGGEDELGCFSLTTTDESNLTLTSGQLRVQLSDQIQPLCSSHWTQQLSDHICVHLGHEKSSETIYIPEISSPQSFYFELTSDVTGLSDILGNLQNVTNCSSRNLINISCSAKECGKRFENLLTTYIAGGELSPLGKWPWVVSLTYLGEPLCSAAIVTSQWLVTAGHCVSLPGSHDYAQTPFYLHASAGSVKRFIDRRSGGNIIAADKIIQHPNFTYTGLGSILWDIALVHLEQPLTFTEVIQPICLPMNGDRYHDNCYLAGWGYINNDQGQLPEYLREAKVQVWEDETCRQDTVPLETSVNTNITLCAGYAGGILSGCQGDSGGPLMCEDTRGHWFLEGVLSSGSTTVELLCYSGRQVHTSVCYYGLDL